MRLPAHEETKRREKLWKLMRKLKQFTAMELSRKAKRNRTSIREYLSALEKAGYIKILSSGGKCNRKVYALIKDAPEPPRVRSDGTIVTQGIGREQMWRSMRILKHFSLEDLIATSSTEERQISREEARKYCYYLTKAGYLRHEGDEFILVKITGPKAPVVQRAYRVWDPNTKEMAWLR